MATIVIHAGMHKTGSTSIQEWISENSIRLREQHGVQTVVWRLKDGVRGRDSPLERYESGGVNSSPVIRAWFIAQRPAAFPRRLVEGLAAFAETSPTVLFSAEWLGQGIAMRDGPLLSALDELANEHEVRVAYYVRPQHSSLEATWRQGGYRGEKVTPSEWVVRAQELLHYARTLKGVEELAPNVVFGVRPFVRELLDGASPVEDFVRRFLSIDEGCREVHANPADPLELVNMLRLAPAEWFRIGPDNPRNYPRHRIKRLFEGLEVRESPAIHRSRQVLQQHCHEVFEAENQQLIRRLGWPIDGLVPPVDDLGGGWTLDEIDRLWQPEASQAERSLLYHAVRAALT